MVARGVRVPLTRAYHSYLRTPTALGPGWTHSYAKRIVPYSGGVSYEGLNGTWDFESGRCRADSSRRRASTGTALTALADGYASYAVTAT